MYEPLPTAHHTRLLELVSHDDECIHLRLVIADTNDYVRDKMSACITHPELEGPPGEGYDALSYTWGSPVSGAEYEEVYTQRRDIVVQVDGTRHTMSTGLNLYEALEQMTKSTFCRPLWIDAICIDQNNMQEKVQHISLMCAIYSKARRVIVWMGRDIYNDFGILYWLHSEVLDTIDRFCEWHAFQHIAIAPLHDNEDSVRLPQLGDSLIPGDAFRALFRFYGTRRYHYRAWITQEVSLGTDRLLLLGDKQLGLAKLRSLLHRFANLDDLIAKFDASGNMPDGDVMPTWTADRELYFWKGKTSLPKLQHLCGSTGPETHHLAFVLYLMIMTSYRRATDPRDQIYSMLPMADFLFEANHRIQPDYLALIQTVFTSFTRLLLESLTGFTALSLVCERRNTAGYARELPSWVPDYGAPFELTIETTLANEFPLDVAYSRDLTPKAIDNLRAYTAGGGDLCGLRFVDHKLFVRARYCGTIDFTFREQDHTLPRAGADLCKFTHFLGACLKLDDQIRNSLLESLICVTCYDVQAHADDFCLRSRIFLARLVAQITSTESSAKLRRTLTALRPHPAIPTEEDIRLTEQWLAAYSWLQQHCNEPDSVLKGYLLQYRQTLCELAPEHLLAKKLGERNVEGWDEISTVNSDNREWLELEQYMEGSLLPRFSHKDTFFSIKAAVVGRTTAKLQEGDQLWLICQARMAHVLRPHGDDFLLVGEAFVMDGMNGELIQDGTAQAAREICIV